LLDELLQDLAEVAIACFVEVADGVPGRLHRHPTAAWVTQRARNTIGASEPR
jgi:hypothetical protein